MRFREAFERDFGHECGLLENPQAVAEVILGKSPMAVLLLTLHLELLTQQHYTEGYREGDELDTFFASLLKHHWMEEAQHAKLDVLELVKLRNDATPEQVQQTVDDYFAIAGAFAGLLAQQGKLDVVSLERAVGRAFSDDERAKIEQAQTRSYQRAFLWCGVTNTAFLEFLAEHFPAALPGAAKAAEAFA